MKFFVAQRIQKHLPEQEAMQWLPKHGEYMQYGVDQNIILLAGPIPDADGGFTILRAESKEQAEEFLAKDPMVQEGLQHYEVNEFLPLSKAPEVENWCK